MSLYLLAFLGGVLTLLSPCILPVLPFVFARTGRPFSRGSGPLLVGMAAAFAGVASLGAVAGTWAVRLHQTGRVLALAALAVFALALLWPRLAHGLTQPLVRAGNALLARRWGGASNTGRGASLLIGVATGLVWSPCAGPILGLILSGAALAGPSVHGTLLLAAYAGGAALALAVLLHAGEGRRARWRARLGGGAGARRVLGAAMLGGVVAVATGLDTGLLARLSLDAGTAGLEQRLLQSALVTGGAMGAASGLQRVSATQAPGVPSGLPVEPIQPSFEGGGPWLNSPPRTAEALRGKVVLVNFWTYSCINCLRTLPHVRAWAQKYADQGLVVLGVHTPEFAFEKDTGNVQRALRDLKIDYPVVQDNRYGIWRAFHNQYWPAIYLVDAQGRVRHHQFGEGGAGRTEAAIQALLREVGHPPAAPGMAVQAPQADTRGVGLPPDSASLRTPETYLGHQQGSGFASPEGVLRDRPRAYTLAALRLNRWGLRGEWTVAPEYVQLEQPGGSVALRFQARDAHLVLGTVPGRGPVRFRLTLDGQPPGADHGEDVDAEGRGTLDAQRLYQLVRQKGAVDERTVEIQFLDAGARAYAFTFG
ncbi:MAG: cytochrome c biogenesis protein CcdA [Pseudomonadota bacterium]|nr:cytochrome c biogenesis protein CcdA [Pseudomonadota bacterium]